MIEEKLYEVHHRIPGWTGRRRGVQFRNGVGKCTRRQALEFMKNFRYSVPELEKHIDAAKEKAVKKNIEVKTGPKESKSKKLKVKEEKK
jgi:hypothetical protein